MESGSRRGPDIKSLVTFAAYLRRNGTLGGSDNGRFQRLATDEGAQEVARHGQKFLVPDAQRNALSRPVVVRTTKDEAQQINVATEEAGHNEQVIAMPAITKEVVTDPARQTADGAKEVSLSAVEFISSVEARASMASRIQKGVQFFGEQELLKEAAAAASETLVDSTLPVPGQLSSYRPSRYEHNFWDYMHSDETADFYMTYSAEVDRPTIHVGFRDGEAHEVIFERRRSEGDMMYETQVVFFGLSDKAGKKGETLWQKLRDREQTTSIEKFYPISVNGPDDLSQDRLNEDYPPVGAYISFSILTDSGSEVARLSGIVGTNTTRDHISPIIGLQGYGSRRFFPFLPEDFPLHGRFPITVDNATLGSSEQTLREQFFTNDIMAWTNRMYPKE